jgi:hypothetical protein
MGNTQEDLTMDSQTLIWIGIAVVALVAIAAVAWSIYARRHSERLRNRFGPEYERALERHGNRRKAEADLAERARRVEKLTLRPLTAEETERFARSWKTVQSHFVDNPTAAVSESNALIKELMQARGYPVGDFEERAADLSVEHAEVVTHYRAARDIALGNEKGKATTEDLRQAVVHYRALFQELLDQPVAVAQAS